MRLTRTRAGHGRARHDTIEGVATPKVTMIGGGQLARMTHQSAIALGQTLRVLAVTADDPAAQGIRHAARGIVAMFPAELPMLQVVPTSAEAAAAPAPTGFELPVVQG